MFRSGSWAYLGAQVFKGIVPYTKPKWFTMLLLEEVAMLREVDFCFFLTHILASDVSIIFENFLLVYTAFLVGSNAKNDVIDLHEMKNFAFALNVVGSDPLIPNSIIEEGAKNIGINDIQVRGNCLYPLAPFKVSNTAPIYKTREHWRLNIGLYLSNKGVRAVEKL